MLKIACWLFSVLITLTLIYSCQNDSKKITNNTDLIIQNSQDSHGSAVLRDANISFHFRDHEYQRRFENGEEVFVRKTLGAKEIVLDEWKGSFLRRWINGKEISLSDSVQKLYMNSINSVFYFFTLPMKLNDDAVRTKYLGEETVSGTDYYKIEITFDEEGGGDDHEDIYVYWFNKDNYLLEYLAYQYFTNGGGMRFRSAINRQEIAGAIVQDYANYRPIANCSVYELAKAMERGELVLISNITKLNIAIEPNFQ